MALVDALLLGGIRLNLLLAIFRNNVIRQINGLMQSNPYAFDLTSVEKAVIENNVIELAREEAMRFYHANKMHFFNNRKLAGKLFHGMERVEGGGLKKRSELAGKIEDATLLSI